ncbi:MAG: sodium/proton-translocating pyrophosphatase, partial [Anaerolinea sp.]|nr:sodium/proton-translocating pyrophosphatase [Anaerolinea sp.]
MDFITENASWLALLASAGGIVFAVLTSRWLLSQDAGSERVQKIGAAIQKGASAFLSREYRYVAILVVIVAIALLILSAVTGNDSNPRNDLSPWTVVAFVSGAVASATAGFVGMTIATRADMRTTTAATKSLNEGLRVAFASGSVMGTMVVSLALLGIGALFLILTRLIYPDDPQTAASALAGFGFGGTSIAIFARVGGGIFTKAADVGADLV